MKSIDTRYVTCYYIGMDKFDDLTDTKEHKRARQQKRRDALNKVAKDLGFDSWDKLGTAVINSEITLTIRRNKMDFNEFLENQILAAKEERELEFPAEIRVENNRVTIDTRITRNSNLSNNGGDYSFWMTIWPNEYGQILTEERCTCDHWQPQEEPELWVGEEWDGVLEDIQVYAEWYGVPIAYQ